MSDSKDWADAQQEKLDRVTELLNEVVYTHKKMQTLLLEATIKSKAERGLRDIEHFLDQNDK